MSYTRKVLEGLSAQLSLKVIGSGLTLMKLAILARLLTPEQFGLFSLTTIGLGVTEAVTETGINLTILQSNRPITYFLDTAWVISIFRGVLIAIIMMLIGWFMSIFYQNADLLFLVAVASGVPLIKGFINPAIIMLQRNLNFFSDGMYRISLVLVEAITAIILVWLTQSIYGLIFAMIIAAVWEVTLSFFLFKNRPGFHFIKSRAETIFNNTKWLSISAVLSYLHENLDNLLIGKIIGTANLGYYDLGYKLSHKSHELAKATHFSTLPIYIRLKHESRRLQHAFIKTMSGSMTLLIIPALLLIIYPRISVIVLGENWLPILPIVPILAAASLLHSFITLSYTLFYSQEKYARVTWHLAISTAVMAILVVILGERFGLIGAAWAILISRAINVPLVLQGIMSTLKVHKEQLNEKKFS